MQNFISDKEMRAIETMANEARTLPLHDYACRVGDRFQGLSSEDTMLILKMIFILANDNKV